MTDRLPQGAIHGTPITPRAVLEHLGARNYLVNHFTPHDAEWVDENASFWVGDNGVFPLWQAAKKTALASGERFDGVNYTQERYDSFVAWCRRWCLEGSGRCKWVAIPDPIGTSTQELDAFLRMWPADLKDFGVPVYHLDEPIDRAIMLLRNFGRMCIGAVGDYEVIPSPAFCARMDELFDAIQDAFGYIPDCHMFRGLQLLKPEFLWPVKSADSTDVGRNHNQLKWRRNPKRLKNYNPTESTLFDGLPSFRGERVSHEDYLFKVTQMANRWDAMGRARTQTWRTQAERIAA
jgi:hypothetical protein